MPLSTTGVLDVRDVVLCANGTFVRHVAIGDVTRCGMQLARRPIAVPDGVDLADAALCRGACASAWWTRRTRHGLPPLDVLYAIAAARDSVLSLRRDAGPGRLWVAFIGDDPDFAASSPTPNGAVRALADKLRPRSLVLLSQREESHG